MSTLLNPIRPPTHHRCPSRIVERTTTITREIFLDDPAEGQSQSGTETVTELQRTSSAAADDIHGIARALVRLGVWLIEAGRRHALRPSTNADQIARSVDAAKAHDMRHFIGLPN